MQKEKALSLKTPNKIFTSFEEIERTYFPNQILQRLEETLCSELQLTEPHWHRLKTNNSKTGLLEVAKPPYNLKSIKDITKIIELFYKNEGYETKTKDNFIGVRKKKENYWINIIEGETYYSISVHNSLLKSFNLN